MWHAHKNGTDVLRSTRETVAWGESAPASGEGSERGEERAGKEINLYLLGLLHSVASYFYVVFSFEVSKSHCAIL